MKITILEESINFPLSLMPAEGYSHERSKDNFRKAMASAFLESEEKKEIGFYHKKKAVCIKLEKEPIFSINQMTPAKGGGFVSFEVVYKNAKGTFSVLEPAIFSSNSQLVNAK